MASEGEREREGRKRDGRGMMFSGCWSKLDLSGTFQGESYEESKHFLLHFLLHFLQDSWMEYFLCQYYQSDTKNNVK